MKTLVYCTAFSNKEETWELRYRWWLRSIQASELEHSQLLIVDDGSNVLPQWDDIEIIRESDAPTPSAAKTTAPVVLYHFERNLGRRALLDFPGWHRSFAFGALYAQAHGFDRVIHLESDAHLVSSRLQRFMNRVTGGWTALWCEKYQMPELAVQVIAGAAVDDFASFVLQPYSELIGRIHEHVTPYHCVVKHFVGDRYGEDFEDVPKGIDYSSQTHPRRNLDYYWWIDERIRDRERDRDRPVGSPAAEPAFTLDISGPAFGRGWSVPEGEFRWAVDFDSILNLPNLPARPHLLEFTAAPVMRRPHVPQRLLVLFNNRLVWEGEVRSTSTVLCEIPAEAVNSEWGNVVRLVHPDATAPSAIIDSNDDRLLAFAISNLTLTPLDNLDPG